MLGIFHTCPQMLLAQSRRSGRTRISRGRCRGHRPPTCTPRCWCCNYNTPPSSHFRSDTPRSHTLRDLQGEKSAKLQKAEKHMNNLSHSYVTIHLRRVPHGSGHRNNCRTRSTARRFVRSWMHDTYTGHSSTPPDHCISLTHCWGGSCSTKSFPHCIHTLCP